MDRLQARYPFLRDAKAAVEEADIDLEHILAEERSPILERALARVEGAVTEGRVPDPIADSTVELLSYPVARVLISLVDHPVLTDRYALAEARRGFDLFQTDAESDAVLRSTTTERLSLEALLTEFDLNNCVGSTDRGFDIAVTSYLSLSTELREHSWRLVNRSLADGVVSITHRELELLLQEAIRLRVADGLPLDVPEELANGLESHVKEIQSSLANVSIPGTIDEVNPALFPLCISTLLDRVRAGDEISPPGRFTLVSFLCCIGASRDDILDLLDVTDPTAAQMLDYQIKHLHGHTRSTAYPPPSCETLDALGLCEQDSACSAIGHPLAAYAETLPPAG